MTYLEELRAERARLEQVRADLKAERERIQSLVMMLSTMDQGEQLRDLKKVMSGEKE